MAKKFTANEKITIELINGKVIETEFVQDVPDGIVVINSRDLNTGKLRQHNQTFYHQEIKSITPINTNGHASTSSSQNEASTTVTTPTTTKTSTKLASGRQRFVSGIEKKVFSEREIENIQNFVKNANYIAQYDDKYYKAIDDLKQQELIGVNSENRFGRLDMKRPLLTLTTPNQVYLFDLLRLGAMKKEMKEIFYSELPLKVVHSSAPIADYLKHTEKCALNNIFDTLVCY